MKRVAVILAAGTGSRMGNLSHIPKSLIRIPKINKCTLEMNIDNLIDNGVDKIIIITGYKSAMICDFIDRKYKNHNITCIYNPFYEEYGCEYSLSLSIHLLSDITNKDQLLILEADTVMNPYYVWSILNHQNDLSYSPDGYLKVLGRDYHFLNDKKSVLVVSSNKLVTVVGSRFVYDSNHESVTKLVHDNERKLCESMQVWLLTGNSLLSLINKLKCYCFGVHKADNPKYLKRDGLFSLNEVASEVGITPVIVSGLDWYNLNTADDLVEIGGKVNWIR